MGLTKERERLLISRIQKDDDEQALKELYYSCLPVIGGTIKQYFVELYDSQDWEQEALILCYKTAKCFDLKQGKPFVGFYKVSLHNRDINLIRRGKRKKRLAASDQVYWEDVTPELEQASCLIASPPVPVLDWQDLVESLSMLELEELLLELGYKQAGEIMRQYQVNEMGLRRAKYRVKEKIKLKLRIGA
ncbi:sigma-70 family RNA polymerase sigma factor [Lactobacillus delbrueckii subsp. lactis]|uniref:sigma-70 family RNA polymerase sigma factor n=1 Tax=Lactobacillus delbrueckii TaxID=1584 RepID=UPI001E5E9BF0|nr:sigma-70 family RNA polymerase sigma factor [Lactobacillus delbrueckii]MCD5560925.1 sigma-70 family RNA polymerase sigma factor [Lactobacillus delbrueckii subsp. lactis]